VPELDRAAQLEKDLRIAVQLPLSGPNNHDVVDAARLLMRYPAHQEGQFGCECCRTILSRITSWGMDVGDLQAKARALWQAGYRPSDISIRGYGSGADAFSGSDQ
jgi:hypothetical protein